MFKNRLVKVLNHKLFPWVICLLAFITGLPFLNYRDVWADEAFTLFYAQKPLKEIWALSMEGEPNPPLFMFIIHFWIKLVGINSAWVRLVPLMFHALTAGLIYKIGKELSGNFTGLLASCLFLGSFEHFYFAFEIRTYSLISFCTAASLYSFIRLRTEFSILRVLLLFLSNLAIIYSHYFGWFVLLNQLLFLFFIIKEKSARYSILASFVVLLICYVPVLQALYKQFLHAREWNDGNPAYFSQLISEVVFFLNGKIVFLLVLILLLLGLAVKMVVFRKRRKQGIQLKDADGFNILFLFLWFFIPYIIVFLWSYSMPVFVQRYILFCTIGFYLFLAMLIHYLYKEYNLLKWAIAMGLIVFMFTNIDIYRKDFYYREVKASVNYAKTFDQPGTRVVLYPYWVYHEFMYYYNPGEFADYNHIEDNLKKRSIYPVWHWEMIRGAMRKDTGQYSQIILFQDCGEHDSEIDSIYDYLRQNHIATDSAFFSQTFKVTIYKKINN